MCAPISWAQGGAEASVIFSFFVRRVAAGVVGMADEMNFKHVPEGEHALMKRLHDQGNGVGKIAKQLGRSKDTVHKHVFAKNTKRATKQKGRPLAFPSTPKGYAAMEKVYGRLLKQSKGKTEVTAQMVKEEMGLSCATKTVSRAFWNHGVYFRPQYEKPDLDDADKKERKQWGEANKHRSAVQWNKYLHAVIDNKVFQVYPNGKWRDVAARRKVRGAYRQRRRVFKDGYVKPPNPKALKQNTGVKSAMITCAIGAGKVFCLCQKYNQFCIAL